MSVDTADLWLMRLAELVVLAIVVRNLPKLLLLGADVLRAIAFGVSVGTAAAIATFETLQAWKRPEDRQAEERARHSILGLDARRPRPMEKP